MSHILHAKKGFVRTLCFMLVLVMLLTSFPAVDALANTPDTHDLDVGHGYEDEYGDEYDDPYGEGMYGDEYPDDYWSHYDGIPLEAIAPSQLADFASAGIAPANSGIRVYINNATQLLAFLNGTLTRGPTGPIALNNDIFVLTADIDMTHLAVLPQASLPRGRGLVGDQPFTGVFMSLEGENFTITGLRLRPRAVGDESPAGANEDNTPGFNDAGFIRLAGPGARIENVTFRNLRHVDTVAFANSGSGATLVQGWNAAEGNIGLLIGRTIAGPGTVTIHNVGVLAHTVGITTTRSEITITGRAVTNKRVGGMVGRVDVGSTLNITNVNTDINLHVDNTGTRLPSVGGLVGHVLGNVNVRNGQYEGNTFVHSTTARNELNFTTGPATGGTIRGQHVGGVIGRIDNAAAQVEVSRSNIRGHVRAWAAATTLTGTAVAGGVVGSSTSMVAGGVRVNNVSVYADIQADWDATATNMNNAILNSGGGVFGTVASTTISNVNMRGQVHTRGGRIGGLIGASNGAVWIEHSTVHESRTPLGAVQWTIRGWNSLHHLGGILGVANPGGNVVFYHVENHGLMFGQSGASPNRNHGGLIGWTRVVTHIDQSANHGTLTSGTGAGTDTGNSRGGLVGRSENRIYITNSANHGFLNITTGRPHPIGGIIGRSIGRVEMENVTNTGNISQTGGTVAHRRSTFASLGGIIGRGFHGMTGGDNRQILLTNVTNHGDVGNTAAAAVRNRAGGIIGTLVHPSGVAPTVRLNNVVNTGEVRSVFFGAGLIAFADNANITIENSINRGTVSIESRSGSGQANDTAARRNNMGFGGLVGRAGRPNLRILNSANEGNVIHRGHHNGSGAGTGIGGIIGDARAASGTTLLDGVYNTGHVSGAQTSRVGGLVGRKHGRSVLEIRNSYNLGSVWSDIANGGNGILGFMAGTAAAGNLVMVNVYNAGSVRGRPIYNEGAQAAGRIRRATFNNVFWDSDVHTGA
ncbi:MAG: hypothetical protein FWD84_03095, partial [Oscillospiraceae bacterium]|nr:hypothetical protein [Oscillospiraceae bacterium]